VEMMAAAGGPPLDKNLSLDQMSDAVLEFLQSKDEDEVIRAQSFARQQDREKARQQDSQVNVSDLELWRGGKKTRKNRKIKIRKFSKDKNKKNKKNKKQTKNKKHKKGKTRNLKKKPKKTRRRRTY